ncbi:glycosyltransferase [Sphingobacterium hungaricum]|uniref:Glycosyl transferase family 1 n=1 Tax=Sphingobacterium hungaricum TaxID=2082723 RepID=A0A928YPX2_9SPHI|nr:glycosyltransferase [Sphingobacterium hungaricum]MBE8712350.1 glycosyl transferase family 1 [Sphingobacterium hungaricum]
MKILQIGKFYPIRGGVEKVMYDLTLGLSEAGIHCDMLCATTEDHPGGIITLNENGRVIAMKTQLKFAATMIAPGMISKLRSIAKEYDVVHIHHPDPMATLALFISGYKGKIILHWHSDILKQKTLLKLYKPLQDWLIKRADYIVGTTPVYVNESSFLQHVQNKIDFIPIGVESIASTASKVAQIREKYPNKKIVFSLGRLVEYKGYAYLVEAANYLTDDYIVLIGGMGPLKEELQASIDKNGLSNKIELLGFISDEEVANYFQACDLFCLSSILKTEAFAIVQIEAMSCAKPVISTDIKGSGVSWVNSNGESGLVVPCEDSKSLADAIVKIMGSPDYYNELSQGALDRYSTQFTRKNMIDKCIKLYNKLLLN